MKARLYLAIVLCVVLLVLLVVLWPGGKDQPATVTPGKIEGLSRRIATPTAPSGAELIPTSAPSEQHTIAKSHSTQKSLHVSIADAIGDSVSSGQVKIGTAEYSFINGHLEIAEIESGTHTLRISADGYNSATKTVSIPVEQDVAVTLEYLCSFEIVVYSDREQKSPVQGAGVLVWEGPRVQRPVGTEAAPNVYLASWEPDQLRLHRDESGIHVVDVDSYQSASGLYDSDPEPGDTILGVGGLMWQLGEQSKTPPTFPVRPPVSLRLRVWDAIVAHETGRHTRGAGDFIEFERNGSRHNCATGKMDPSQRGRVAVTGTTDSSGRCRFENLAAGTYFIQARKDNSRTEIAVIGPAGGGQNLYLTRAGTLHLLVKYAASSVFAAGAIAGANIELKSPQSLIPIVRQTNEFGEVDISPVFWGSYQLTVSPPQALFLESKTMPIDIEEPDEFLCVEFEAKRYSISGTVLTVGKKKPVADFGLGLRCLSVVLEAPRSAKSKEDGSFVFSGLRPGEYEIRPDIPRGTYKGYMPAGWELALGDPKQARIKVTLEDRDVTGLEYFVVGGVKTRFQGKVTMSDGSPVPDADVSLDVPEYITDSGDKTGEDGRFDLRIFLPPDNEEHRADIKAIVRGPRPVLSDKATERTMDVGGGIVATVRMRQPFGQKHQQTLLQGSCPVEFKVGDTVRDIHVVMKGPEEAPAVVGRIITEDGNWPIPVAITVSYENDQGPELHGQIADDGSFRVDWMHPGPFTMRVQFYGSLMAKVDSTFGWRPNAPVCSKFIDLEMPMDQKILHVDVPLSKAGQIAGRVIDKDSRPIVGARIFVHGTDRYPGHSITAAGTFETNEDGLFWVYGQQVGKEHTVEVIPPGASEPAARLEGIKPPEQNIVIMLNNEQ